jgi:hypothetical protein
VIVSWFRICPLSVVTHISWSVDTASGVNEMAGVRGDADDDQLRINGQTREIFSRKSNELQGAGDCVKKSN